MEDFTAIAPYKEGKITKEEAAERLMCTPDYVDEYIRYVEGEGLSDVEYAFREEGRRYGSSFVAELEHNVRLEFADGCVDPPKYYGRR